MIILQTGVPGSGKTASIVFLLMSDETYTHFTDKDGVKKERPLFVNGISDLKINHQELDDDQIKSQPLQDFLPYGALVIIDEAQRLMGTRLAASKVPLHIEALATHRHHGLDIVLITQHPSFLDPFVRKLVQRHMHISIKPVGRKLYEWNECVDQPDSRSNIDRAIERQFTLPKKAFDMYKSAEIHTKVSRRLPKSLIFMLLFLPIALVFGVYTFNRIKHKYNPNDDNLKVVESEVESNNSNNNYINVGGASNQQYSMSLRAEMLVPTVPEKPESKPLYDNVRQVKTFERVAACVKSGKSCNCYSDQATLLPEISTARCLKYVKDGLPFNPYRDEQAMNSPAEQNTAMIVEPEQVNDYQVMMLSGQNKIPKTEPYPDNLKNIQ